MMLLRGCSASSICNSSSCCNSGNPTVQRSALLQHRSLATTPQAPLAIVRQRQRQVLLQQCRAQISPQSGGETEGNSAQRASSNNAQTTQTPAEDAQARSEAQTIGELKRQQLKNQSQTNVIQGALEEAQLITWPSLRKAFADTILVIAIVAATGSVLFGVNVLLTEGSEWWYSR